MEAVRDSTLSRTQLAPMLGEWLAGSTASLVLRVGQILRLNVSVRRTDTGSGISGATVDLYVEIDEGRSG